MLRSVRIDDAGTHLVPEGHPLLQDDPHAGDMRRAVQIGAAQSGHGTTLACMAAPVNAWSELSPHTARTAISDA